MTSICFSQVLRHSIGCLSVSSAILLNALAGNAQPVAPVPFLPGLNLPEQPFEPIEVTGEVFPPSLVEDYALGAGDRIYIDIFSVPEYTGEKRVAVDGSVNLPLVRNVSVDGMTVEQAADAIAVVYSHLLRDPIVTVSLIAPRPLRIGISGEVNRPGSYAVPLTDVAGDEAPLQWPTVTQVIELAGGITSLANVREIQVRRPQRSGEEEIIPLDLWALVQTGALQEDLKVRDGDMIVIPTIAQVDPTEATRLATASFSPDTIQVNVVGEVVTPGAVEVRPNTPLNQALLAAGGFDNRRAKKGTVQLVRLNPDGSVSERTVQINLAEAANEQTNPVLRNNDVIIVGRSGSASFSDALDGILETLGRIFPIFTLF